MKKIAALTVVLMLTATNAFAAEKATSIAFSKPISQASGYVLKVATDAALEPSCPSGFMLMQGEKKNMLAGGKVQVFSCIKG